MVLFVKTFFLLYSIFESNAVHIHECALQPGGHNGNNSQEVSSLEHPMRKDRKLRLYHSAHALTWCESFNICQENGKSLSTAKDSSTRVIWETLWKIHQNNFEAPAGEEFAWVASKRKDFGRNWTWLDNNLTDCTVAETELCGQPHLGELWLFHDNLTV